MNAYTLLLSAQLLYYLLITQTGVVGAFDSHIHDLYTLPIGGVLGSLFAAFIKHNHIKIELYALLFCQLLLSLFYPHYSLLWILLLGFIVGYTTPLLFFIFKDQKKINLAIGLGLSYAIGTALYSYPFEQRDSIAFVLSVISIASLFFLELKPTKKIEEKMNGKIIAILVLWIFADSALFETLSRSIDMDIWSHYTLTIITFHIIGILVAYKYPMDVVKKHRIIFPLFLLSYLLFTIKIPILLAIIYPFTISYYNFSLFRYIINLNNIKTIGITMVLVGWVATSLANAIALEKQIWIVYLIFALFCATFFILNRRKYEKSNHSTHAYKRFHTRTKPQI
jgi:beta-carotene 15,15'-dioxygenase